MKKSTENLTVTQIQSAKNPQKNSESYKDLPNGEYWEKQIFTFIRLIVAKFVAANYTRWNDAYKDAREKETEHLRAYHSDLNYQLTQEEKTEYRKKYKEILYEETLAVLFDEVEEWVKEKGLGEYFRFEFIAGKIRWCFDYSMYRESKKYSFFHVNKQREESKNYYKNKAVELRKEGLSIAQIAEKLGLSERSISRYFAEEP